MAKKRIESARARRKRLRRAREAKPTPVTYKGGSRSYVGIFPDSPLTFNNLESLPPFPKRQRTSKSSAAEPLLLPQTNDHPDVPLPLFSVPGSSSSVFSQLYTMPLLEEAPKCERRWQAVTIALVRETQLNRRLSLSELDDLAKERDLGSGRSMRRYVEQATAGGLLTPKKPTGRKPHVLNQVNEFMQAKAASFKYHFSHEVMAQACKDSQGIGSASTVRRVIKKNFRLDSHSPASYPRSNSCESPT
jgi:hypothetical protein